jgi:hypothetical protein
MTPSSSANAAPPKAAKKRRLDLRTGILVTLITMLIWLLAESRTVQLRVTDLSPRLEVTAASRQVVRPPPGVRLPETVKLTLSGSAAGVNEVIRSLEGRLTLRVGIEVPASPGIHEINLREVLRDSDLIVNAGVGVLEVNPDRISVEVDDLTSASLPVRVIAPEGVAFETQGAPRALPSVLRLRGPASVLARLAGSEAVVYLDPARVAELIPGQPEMISRLRVDVPQDPDRWATTVEPEYLDVALTLRSRTQTLVLAAMPVQVLLAPGEVGRWSVTLQPGDQDMVGVEVTGPSDQIERLRSGEIVPTALIALSFDELERAVESKVAQIQGLPPGVQVAPGSDMGVRLTITRPQIEEPAARTPD